MAGGKKFGRQGSVARGRRKGKSHQTCMSSFITMVTEPSFETGGSNYSSFRSTKAGFKPGDIREGQGRKGIYGGEEERVRVVWAERIEKEKTGKQRLSTRKGRKLLL